MPRPVRTSLFALAGVIGALIGGTPAHAVPDGAVPLFEPSLTERPQDLQILGRTAAGTAWTEGYAWGVWVQPTGGEPALDDTFLFPDMVGDLISEVSDDGTEITWRTIADPEIHVHSIPAGIDYGSRTATGYVGVRGTGPYEVVLVDLLSGGEPTVLGTSTRPLGNLVTSSSGVAAMTSKGGFLHIPFASPGTVKVVTMPGLYMECPWLSRAHLFCYDNDDSGVVRISVSTGAVSSTTAYPGALVETSTGVAFLDEGQGESEFAPYSLRTWATTAAAPTVRVGPTFALNGSLAPSGTSGSVLVGRGGALGTAGIWSVPIPSGTSALALVAAAEPRRADWNLAVAPGSVAWADSSHPSGNLWTRDLAADGTPTGDNRLLADHADASTLSASAGRFTYTSTSEEGTEFIPGGTRLIDGATNTSVDGDGWTAVLSGDRLLTDELSHFTGEEIWRLRDLRSGESTTLPAAMDYDLWGERLVRLEENGRVTAIDLRTGDAPVELRPAAAGTNAWLWGSVYVAGDTVAWDVVDGMDWTGLTGERATRDLVSMAPATQLPDDVVAVADLSTGYVLVVTCTGNFDCVTKAIAVDDATVTDLGLNSAAVDGTVVAGVDRDGMPSVQTLPAYADAPRLLADPSPSTLAGPGRTWQARVVTSRVLSTCSVEIHDADDVVVRTLPCVDPHAAETVEWDGMDDEGVAVPAGEYTWHLAGDTDGTALVDYDLSASALSGSVTVSDVPAPTVTASSPAAGALRVSPTANVTARFDEDLTGVSGTTFRLREPDGTPVPAVVSYDAATKTATLNPTGSLLEDTTFTATLTGGDTAIRGAVGGPLETTRWTFTTGPAPAITALAPANNSFSATLGGNLTAKFDEPVTGLDSDTFQLRATGGDPVAGAVTYSSATRTATFNPTVNLLPDKRYTATLTGGASAVRDLAGNPLTTRSWTFTTGPAPTVTGKSPAANATGVGRTANVVAAFSEPVVGVSSTTVKLKTSSGTAVSATISYSATSRKVTVNPTKTLTAETKYTVTLTGGTTAVRDTVGNPMATTSWSFTTGR